MARVAQRTNQSLAQVPGASCHQHLHCARAGRSSSSGGPPSPS
jgi:hypothetical protein